MGLTAFRGPSMELVNQKLIPSPDNRIKNHMLDYLKDHATLLRLRDVAPKQN